MAWFDIGEDYDYGYDVEYDLEASGLGDKDSPRWFETEPPTTDFPYRLSLDLRSCVGPMSELRGEVSYLARFDSKENAIAASILLSDTLAPIHDEENDQWYNMPLTVTMLGSDYKSGRLISIPSLNIRSGHLRGILVRSVFDEDEQNENAFYTGKRYQLVKEPIDRRLCRYKRIAYFGSYRDAWIAQQFLSVLLPKEHYLGAGISRRSELAILPLGGAPMPDGIIPHNYVLAKALINVVKTLIIQDDVRSINDSFFSPIDPDKPSKFSPIRISE